jgi:hypothetical protein
VGLGYADENSREGAKVWKVWAASCAAVALCGSAYAQPAHPDLSGVWEMKFRETIVMDDGKLPPLRPEAAKTYQERVTALKEGRQLPDSATACLPHGVPRIMYTPYPVHIVQRPEVVAFLFEVNHNIRLAYVDQKLPEDPDPTYMGSSVAHWEGSTLVVETNGLNNKIQIDRAGLPQSEATRVSERFDLIDGGKKMRDVITVTDNTLYSAPWKYTVEWVKADYKLMEYVCENNRWPPGYGPDGQLLPK